jgi:folate-binding protein YgfZ
MDSEHATDASGWQAFLASRDARLQGARVADFGDPAAEIAAARDATFLADLSHNALLDVTGDDAIAFLHAQLTNDVAGLPEGAAQWSGWCSAKGRLLATFLLVRRAEGCWLLLPAEIAAPIAKRLAMYVLRSKVTIRDASTELVRFGFAGKTAGVQIARHFGHMPDPMRSVRHEGASCIALDTQRFVIVAPAQAAEKLWDALAEDAVKAGADAWEYAAIHAGIPTIVAATQDAFVPQMANFELVGGVSFKKGCYPGQEIVARTQYRGILKKRMALAHVGGDARPQPGANVYGAAFGEQSAGQVVNAAPAPGGGFDFLVVAQLASLADGDLRLGSPGGLPVEILDHPAAATAA